MSTASIDERKKLEDMKKQREELEKEYDMLKATLESEKVEVAAAEKEVQELESQSQELDDKIKGLKKEGSKIDKLIAALTIGKEIKASVASKLRDQQSCMNTAVEDHYKRMQQVQKELPVQQSKKDAAVDTTDL